MRDERQWNLFGLLKGSKIDNLKDVKEIEKRINSTGVNLLSEDELREALEKEIISWDIYEESEIQKGINSILEGNLGCIAPQSLGDKYLSKDEPEFKERFIKWHKIPLSSILVLKINDKYFFKIVRSDPNSKDELEICLSLLKIIEEVEMSFSSHAKCIAEFNNYLNVVVQLDENGQMKSYLEDRLEEIMKNENNPSIVKYWLITELMEASSAPKVDNNAMNVLEKADGSLTDIWSDFLDEDYVDRTFIYHPDYKKVLDIATSILYLKSYNEIELTDKEYYEICYSMFTTLYHMNKHDTALQFGEKLIEGDYLKETRYGTGRIFVYRVRPYANHGTRRDFLYRKMIELYIERGLYQKAKNLFLNEYKPYYSTLLKSKEFWNNLELLFQYECQCFLQINEHRVGDFLYSEILFAETLQREEDSKGTKFNLESDWTPENINTGEHKDFKEVRIFIEKIILLLVNDNEFLFASNLLTVYSKYFGYSELFINQLSPIIERRIHNQFEGKLSKVWDNLDESSRNNIRMAEFLYFEIKNNGNAADYSTPALCLGKALEFELEKRWALPAEKKSLKENFEVLNERGFKNYQRVNENNVERMISYTLGSYIPTYNISSDDDPDNVDKVGFFKREILSYYEDNKLAVSTLDSIMSNNGTLSKITKNRNDAAHASNTVSESSLLEMIDILIDRNDSLFVTIADGYKGV